MDSFADERDLKKRRMTDTHLQMIPRRIPVMRRSDIFSYQSPIKMCKAHFNCDIVIGTRHIFAMLTLSSRKCNAGTALKTD